MNFAIIGTNFITDWLLEAAELCPEFNLYAVYSRTIERAREYAAKYGAKQIFTSLEDLCSCNEIDAVYIASPTACHYQQAITCMNAGKHVLCEKPIASNLTELESMLKTAKENNVVLLEAMRPEFSPVLKTIKKTMESLGTIRHVSFYFSKYSTRYGKFLSGEYVNAFDTNMSNSALTDLGCYCVHLLLRLFGMPDKIQSSGVNFTNGYGAAGAFLAGYETMIAVVSYSKVSDTHNYCEIQGEEGTIQFYDPVSMKEVYLIRRGKERERILTEMVEKDMFYEVQAFIDYVINPAGLETHHKYSLDVMTVMDEVRRQSGIVYLAD